jgi:di/tripeptidase
VRGALGWLESNFERQVEEWIRITEIPGTSTHEQERAAYVKAQLEAEGYTVTIDSIGNVVAAAPAPAAARPWSTPRTSTPSTRSTRT